MIKDNNEIWNTKYDELIEQNIYAETDDNSDSEYEYDKSTGFPILPNLQDKT